MAVKAITEISSIRAGADGNWLFYVDIHETTHPFRYTQSLELVTTLPVVASTVPQIQAAVVAFAKSWSTSNWGTVWIPGTDSLRVLNPSVTAVNA